VRSTLNDARLHGAVKDICNRPAKNPPGIPVEVIEFCCRIFYGDPPLGIEIIVDEIRNFPSGLLLHKPVKHGDFPVAVGKSKAYPFQDVIDVLGDLGV
jgi:hypothetical protein